MKANNVAAAAAMVAALFASVPAFADYWDDPEMYEWTDSGTGYTWHYRADGEILGTLPVRRGGGLGELRVEEL